MTLNTCSPQGWVSLSHEGTLLHEVTLLHEDTFARDDTFARRGANIFDL